MESNLGTLLLAREDIFFLAQDYLDFKEAFQLMQTCRMACKYLNEDFFWHRCVRRKHLMLSIPPYIDWRLRTVEEKAFQENVEPYFKKLDDLAEQLQVWPAISLPSVDTLCAERSSSGDAVLSKLSVMEQAKVTWLFSKGIESYERKDLALSRKYLMAALDIAPTHDIILCRLGDTEFSLLHEINDEATKVEGKIQTKALYTKALACNPYSAYAYNGLALFEEDRKVKYSFMITALRLNPLCSYALANLGMELEETQREYTIFFLELALLVNQNLFYARTSLALHYFQSHRFDDARKCLSEQVRRRPNDKTSARLLSYCAEIANSIAAGEEMSGSDSEASADELVISEEESLASVSAMGDLSLMED